MSRGASMDATSLDEWELLPDHKSSFFMEECTTGHGTVGVRISSCLAPSWSRSTWTTSPLHLTFPCDCILDEEAKKSILPPLQDAWAQDPVIEFKDIGVVQTESTRGEFMPKVTEILISDAEEEEEMIKCPAGAKEVCEDEVMVEAVSDLCAEEEEGVKKDRRGLDCIVFSVGKLRVNGVGALCSFGVAAATFCIFLLGGRQQQQHNQKIQLQMYADDEQVVQQTSRLNQAMSSVMGGASTRASISFGGYYDGF